MLSDLPTVVDSEIEMGLSGQCSQVDALQSDPEVKSVSTERSAISYPHHADTSHRSHDLRHAAAGTAWILSFAYLLAEVFTAAAWNTPYSFAQNSISSLGVTTCDVDSCSPMHDVMNSTFVVLGVLTLIGALFLHRHIRNGRSKKWILSLAVVIAVSTAATGLFPANDGALIHWTAVLPGFVARHVVLVLIAWHLWHEKRLLAIWSALCAFVGVLGAVLMLAKALHFGLGERLALYPLPTWMAVTGTAVLLALARRTVLRNVDFSVRAFDPRIWPRVWIAPTVDCRRDPRPISGKLTVLAPPSVVRAHSTD